MNERKFSMKERLSMIPGEKMSEGNVYHIVSINKVIHFTGRDKKEAHAIVVNCKEGVFFLPNVIARDLFTDPTCKEVDNELFAELTEKPVKCIGFTSKQYNTRGLTLVYASAVDEQDNTDYEIEDMLADN